MLYGLYVPRQGVMQRRCVIRGPLKYVNLCGLPITRCTSRYNLRAYFAVMKVISNEKMRVICIWGVS